MELSLIHICLSGYIASTGKKYRNHAATIRRWAADDTAKAAPKQGIPDYTYKEGQLSLIHI